MDSDNLAVQCEAVLTVCALLEHPIEYHQLGYVLKKNHRNLGAVLDAVRDRSDTHGNLAAWVVNASERLPSRTTWERHDKAVAYVARERAKSTRYHRAQVEMHMS